MSTKFVGYGVDTLILNIQYSGSSFLPVKKALDRNVQKELDYLQASAHQDENAVTSNWSFKGIRLFISS